MRAVRLHPPGGVGDLAVEELPVPVAAPGEAIVRVHAAAITRDELEWPADRLPATPSYEMSGVVAAVGDGVEAPVPGEEVYALTPFDRDGAAAEYVAVPAELLASKPRSIGHPEAAALPMGGLSAWQGLFAHGGLDAGQRVLIHGAAGGVGHLAAQLARWRGAHVIGTTGSTSAESTAALGVDEVIDRGRDDFADVVSPVDLVFDTVGGDALARSGSVLRDGGRIVSIAEELPDGLSGTYFVVEPDRPQLMDLAELVEQGHLHAGIDSVFPLADAADAFDRVMSSGKRGKVVLQIRA